MSDARQLFCEQLLQFSICVASRDGILLDICSIGRKRMLM